MSGHSGRCAARCDEPGGVGPERQLGGRRPRRVRRRAGATRRCPARPGRRRPSRRRSRRRDARPGRRRARGSARELAAGRALLLAAHVDQAEVSGPEDVEGLVALVDGASSTCPCGVPLPWLPWSRASRVRPHPVRCGHACPWRSRRTASRRPPDSVRGRELADQRPGAAPALDGRSSDAATSDSGRDGPRATPGPRRTGRRRWRPGPGRGRTGSRTGSFRGAALATCSSWCSTPSTASRASRLSGRSMPA